MIRPFRNEPATPRGHRRESTPRALRAIAFALLSIAVLAPAGRAQDAPPAPEAPAPGAPAPVPASETAVPVPETPAPVAATPTAAPPPAPVFVDVTGFKFTGNVSVPEAELKTLLAGYVGKRCDLAKLRAATDAVSEEYRRRGLALARAFLPRQEIVGGVVEIAVLEGKLGEIIVEGNKNYSEKFVKGFIAAAAGEGPLVPERLERGLLLLNEFKDLKVGAGLERGKAPGTVDVRAKVEDRFPLRGTLTFNNFGSDFVSRYRFGAQIDWTNALLPGALFTAAGLIGERPDRLAFGSAAYVVPVNDIGTKVGVNGSYGGFQVAQDFVDLEVHGEAQGGGFFISHPFVRDRTTGVLAEVGFQAKNSKFFFLDELTSRDRVRLVYGALSGDLIHWGGKSFASVNVAEGLGDFLDGSHGDDPQSSRFGADNTFTRVNGLIARLQPLGDYVSVVARFGAQWSSDSLLSSEEWQAGGADSVRGYAPGEAAGDHGYGGSLEVRVLPLEDKELIQLLAFIDHAAAYRKRRLPGQEREVYLSGTGVGLRSHFEYGIEADLRLDVGWPIDPNENSLDENPVLYASVAIRF